MPRNIFAELPSLSPPPAEEDFATLLEKCGLKIERIVSTGQASPPGFWYEQPRAEWILLLDGEAELRFEDENLPRKLQPGDFIEIQALRRHRVDSTAADRHTLWLAIHYDEVQPPTPTARAGHDDLNPD